MIDLASILQAIQRLRPEMLQGLLGGGGNMQSMNGGGFRAEPFAPQPAGPQYSAQPFDPMPFPGPGIPNQVVPDVPGAGSGGRSAGMGMFGRDRASTPALRQDVSDRLRGAPGMGGNRINTRPAPVGQRMGGAIVRPSPTSGGRGNSLRPRPVGRGENAVSPRKRTRRRTY